MTQTDKQREAFEEWVKTQEWKSAGEATMANRAWQAATANFAKQIAHTLYPGGIKHPQQLEPEWIVKELGARMEKLRNVGEAMVYIMNECDMGNAQHKAMEIYQMIGGEGCHQEGDKE